MYDPTVLDRELRKYLPELRDFLKNVDEAMPNGFDLGSPERLANMRAGAAAAGAMQADELNALGCSTADREIEVQEGALRLHIVMPEQDATPDVLYLHFHGGGWAMGVPEMEDAAHARLAQHLNAAVVSVDYRLAPEHPYPAAPDDAEAAALWLLDHAKREFGTDRLLIGGESAGAHLAAVTLLRVRDKYDAIANFEAANFVYGAFDLSRTPSQRSLEPTPVMTPQDVRVATDYFLPKLAPELMRDPDISPLYANVSFLPPAIFTCGTADRLLDDTLFMAARWRAAGNRTVLALYPEAPHGFYSAPIEMGRAAVRRVEDWLAGVVARD